jgi:L-ascorbate metabolism protein UlaG (beta-lactamase superfamily)
MRLTRFRHSCVLVELDGARVLFDPGNFSHGFEGITDLDAIIITHQHPDHADAARLPALVEANPRAVLLAEPSTAAQLGGGWRAFAPGDEVRIGALTARGTGGKHAIIHPDIPQIDNTSVLLGDDGDPGRFYHPGDALHVPEVPVDVLGLPTTAPWCKISETVDYFRAVAPRLAIPIHDAIISAEGNGIYFGRLREMAPDGAELLDLKAENDIDLH